MKALIPCILIAAAAVFVVAQNPSQEQPPPGSAEKIAEALPEKPYAKPAKPRKLLIFSKTNGFRHESIATGKLAFAELGRKTGAFEVVISDSLDEFEIENLKKYDAVCFLSTTLNVFLPNGGELAGMSPEDQEAARAREPRLKDNLMKFIKSGRGFVGIHAATDTCYEWQEYGKMMNGYFDGHPWGAGHQVSIKVEPGQEKHALVAMFEGKNVEFKEEIYQHKDPYDSKSVHMLLRLDTEKTDMNVGGINARIATSVFPGPAPGKKAASFTARSATTTRCIGTRSFCATTSPASSGRSAISKWKSRTPNNPRVG